MIAATIFALAIAQAPAPSATPAQPPTAPTAPAVLPTMVPGLVAPTATPVPTPTPTATPAPAATPSPYAYRFVPHQPAHLAPGQPQIFAVYLNAKTLRSHGPIRMKVETSPDVVKVVSRSNGREGTLALIAAGDFEAASVLPKIPFIAAGMSVDLEFVAIGADGRRTVVRVPVTLD